MESLDARVSYSNYLLNVTCFKDTNMLYTQPSDPTYGEQLCSTQKLHIHKLCLKNSELKWYSFLHIFFQIPKRQKLFYLQWRSFLSSQALYLPVLQLWWPRIRLVTGCLVFCQSVIHHQIVVQVMFVQIANVESVVAGESVFLMAIMLAQIVLVGVVRESIVLIVSTAPGLLLLAQCLQILYRLM